MDCRAAFARFTPLALVAIAAAVIGAAWRRATPC
jgi:hypothetical protein